MTHEIQFNNYNNTWTTQRNYKIIKTAILKPHIMNVKYTKMYKNITNKYYL